MSERQKKPTDFDAYSGDYAALIRDPIRERFAATNRFFFERKLQVIRSFCKRLGLETNDLDWLDVGCGQGDLLHLGRPYFKEAIGCDPSEGMLESCTGLEVKLQPALDLLPFDQERFDFITAVCVYHHVTNERRFSLTKEALRVLKPGGIFCVIEHNPVNPVTRLIVSRTPVDAHAQLLGAGKTRGLLLSAGFRVLETRYFLLLPEVLHKYAAAVEDRLMAIPLGGQYSVFAQR